MHCFLRHWLWVVACVAGAVAPAARAQVDTFMNNVVRENPRAPDAKSDGRIAYGLKEALQLAADRATMQAARPNGYFGDPAIRIGMPERLLAADRGARAPELAASGERLVFDMNRAAERAAPAARALLLEAIRGIGFDDARRILGAGETAATDYFRIRVADHLRLSYAPAVRRSLDEVGARGDLQSFEARADAQPPPAPGSFDLDAYVVARALDGLFRVMGEQEREIRRNPDARNTELLREVFAH